MPKTGFRITISQETECLNPFEVYIVTLLKRKPRKMKIFHNFVKIGAIGKFSTLGDLCWSNGYHRYKNKTQWLIYADFIYPILADFSHFGPFATMLQRSKFESFLASGL